MAANKPFSMQAMERTPPGLAKNERAFQLDTGRKVAVRVQRREALEQGFICIEAAAREIAEDGSTVTMDGVPVSCPPKIKTIQVDLLAEGLTTIEDEIADMTTEAVRRMNNHATALQAWRKIPTE